MSESGTFNTHITQSDGWTWVPPVIYACPICAASISIDMGERHMAWHEEQA